MNVLQFDQVSKHYPGDTLALSNINFTIKEGEMLFVTGHSGAGKSTLLRLIQLSERPSEGEVIFSGRNLSNIKPKEMATHRRKIGMVYQEHRLLMDYSVIDNVALPLILRGVPRQRAIPQVHAMLERLDLGHRSHAFPAQLSAGEQQRVGIARAIIGQPKLLLADEPTGNLDPALASQTMALFASMPEQGTSVLVVSHDLPLIKKIKKRVLVLHQGRLVDDILPQDLAE